MPKPFGLVPVERGDLPSYIHAFARAPDLLGRGAIAQLVMPLLADTFLDYESTKHRLEQAQKDATFWRERFSAQDEDLREEISALWYYMCRDTNTGACPPVPDVTHQEVIKSLRLALEKTYESIGQNLEARLSNLSRVIHTGVLRSLVVEYQEPAEGDSTDCWFVFIAGFCLSSFRTQAEAETYKTRTHTAIATALLNQGQEGVNASMEGRPARYVDRWTGEVPEMPEP